MTRHAPADIPARSAASTDVNMTGRAGGSGSSSSSRSTIVDPEQKVGVSGIVKLTIPNPVTRWTVTEVLERSGLVVVP